ncbi:MAG: hypothetical protein U1F43_13500 [Myxococcota bacterium]
MTTLPTGAELRAWLAEPRSGIVKALVQRLGHGRHALPATVELTRAGGLVGDRWALVRPKRKAQLTLMDARVVERLLALSGGTDLDRPGDNLVVDHATSLAAMPTGMRYRLGGATIELNALAHLGCAKFEARFGGAAQAWVNHAEHLDLRLRGVHATVVRDGVVALGDRLEPLGLAPANLELFAPDDDADDDDGPSAGAGA